MKGDIIWAIVHGVLWVAAMVSFAWFGLTVGARL